MSAFVAVLILVIPTLTSFYRVSVSPRGSDHDVHVVIGSLVRKNRHRFVLEREDFLYSSEMVYPQLFHWLLSFLPESRVESLTRWVMATFTFLLSGAYLWFLTLASPLLAQSLSISSEKLFCLAGVIFLFTPALYNPFDARYRGLSGRTLGALSGQLYLYALVLFFLSSQLFFLFVAVGAGFVGLLGSQLTTQFLLLSFFPLTFFSQRMEFALIPLLSISCFFLLFPSHAKRYLIGQWKHKRFFSKYLVHHWILAERKSIWRDFVYDFWKKCLYAYGGGKQRRISAKRQFIKYVYENSLIRLFLSYPALIVFLFYRGHVAEEIWALEVPIWSCLFLVFATSFKQTRFLGLPERYFEYALGLLPLWGALALVNFEGLLAVLLLVSLCLILLDTFVFGPAFLTNQHGFLNSIERVREQLACLERKSFEQTRLVSNSRLVMKRLMSSNRKLLFGSRTSEQIGSFHYHDVYESGHRLRPEALPGLAKEFHLNTLVVDRKGSGDFPQLFSDERLLLEKIFEDERLSLYRIGTEKVEGEN